MARARKQAAEDTGRRFYLRDPETGEPVPGEVGLTSGYVKVGADGVIPTAKMSAADIDELERAVATAGSAVTEGEPEGVK